MLEETATIAEAAREAQALIWTGRGKRVQRLAPILERGARRNLPPSPLVERLSGALRRCPGPEHAALNGTLAGGAIGMALWPVHLRIDSTDPSFLSGDEGWGFFARSPRPGRLAGVGSARPRAKLMPDGRHRSHGR